MLAFSIVACGGGDPGAGEDASIPADARTGDASDADPERDAGAPASELWVLGYYPGYQRAMMPPDEVDYESLTHLVTFALLPHADGSLDTTLFIDETQGPALARDLATRAHAAGIRALLAIGGAGRREGFVAASQPATRAHFASEIVRVARDYGYDGVDLDWEPITESDQPLVLALVQEIRAVGPELEITVPVGWTSSNAQPVADAFYAELAEHVDRLGVMTYGMSGPWEGWTSWHSSALDGESPSAPTSIDQSVSAYRAAGVPATALGIGIGFYGLCWTGVTTPGQPTEGASLVASDNVMRYAHIAGAYLDAPSARRWDATASVPYLSFPDGHGPEGCTYVSYDDAESIAAKVAYAREHGLGALLVWTINQGHLEDGGDPLLDAIHDAL
nr:chitinase [Sandaracinus sp.]